MKKFAITGASGYVAPRHMRAIQETGNEIVAALDPYDGAGVLDTYSYNIAFFKEPERFDRYLVMRDRTGCGIDYLSVCSPNYLHDAHARMGMRVGADVIVEKPLVVNPRNLGQLEALEYEYNKRVYPIMQLRLHPDICRLKGEYPHEGKCHNVSIRYIASRGPWYMQSWKGDHEKSGGLIYNIGIHFLDMLLWIFGPAIGITNTTWINRGAVRGHINLQHANVDFLLSCDRQFLPQYAKDHNLFTYRSITIDGKEVEFTNGFADLHTKSYQEILAGRGFSIEQVRPAIELAYDMREGLYG